MLSKQEHFFLPVFWQSQLTKKKKPSPVESTFVRLHEACQRLTYGTLCWCCARPWSLVLKLVFGKNKIQSQKEIRIMNLVGENGVLYVRCDVSIWFILMSACCGENIKTYIVHREERDSITCFRSGIIRSYIVYLTSNIACTVGKYRLINLIVQNSLSCQNKSLVIVKYENLCWWYICLHSEILTAL